MNGFGYTTLRGDGPNGSASISGLGSLSTILIGGSVSRGVVVAGMLQTSQVSNEYKGGPLRNVQATADGEPVEVTNHATGGLSSVGVFLDVYPMEQNGLHLGLGAGLGIVSTVNQLDNSTQSGTAGAATLMLGYDWPISRAWALGLALVASGSTTATMKHSKSGNESGYELRPFSIGLSTSVLYF
ncbi:MAG TPA: hypothetical protein VIV60_34705 [Polyangiaceae bacterium]